MTLATLARVVAAEPILATALQGRNELLALFVVPSELLRTYPELGQAFLNSFAWVDAQLAVG